MSNKYPYQNGSRNTEINRKRQRYCHTSEFHIKHLIREAQELTQKRINAYKAVNPERYAEIKAKLGSAHGSGGVATGPVADSLTLKKGALGTAGAGALALGAGLLAVGLGAAAVTNNTLLKDDETLDAEERASRSVGRKMSYVGGIGGAVGTLGAVSASGAVAGLSGAGIASGVSAIGALIGGGVLSGSIIVVALPAVAATGVGYGIYKACQWLRSGKSNTNLIAT